MSTLYTPPKSKDSTVYFEYWQLCNGVWLHSAMEPDLTVKQSWYRMYKHLSEPGVWRYFEADGLDNPGTKSSRVAFDELPAELRLTMALLER